MIEYRTDKTWLGFNGVQGGAAVAALLTGAAEAVPGFAATISAHFFAPVEPGMLEVESALVRGGRTASVSARIGDVVTGLIRVARDAEPAPAADPSENPENLERLELPGEFVPVAQHMDIRPLGPNRPLAGGAEPVLEAWIRLLPSAFALRPLGSVEVAAVLLDALPPALYATLRQPRLIPTAELTAHFAPVSFPASGWLRVRQRTSWSTATLCVDETELFTASGALAAQARQLRRIL